MIDSFSSDILSNILIILIFRKFLRSLWQNNFLWMSIIPHTPLQLICNYLNYAAKLWNVYCKKVRTCHKRVHKRQFCYHCILFYGTKFAENYFSKKCSLLNIFFWLQGFLSCLSVSKMIRVAKFYFIPQNEF